MHFTKLCDAFYRLRKLCQMLLLCSCAFFFILNPKAFFSESFPFPMLFSSNFIIFMPVLHSSQRFRKSEILGLRFCVKSCGINRASQPTHGRRSYTLLISTKAVFSLFLCTVRVTAYVQTKK